MPIPLSDLLKAQRDLHALRPPQIEPDLDAMPHAVSFGLLGHSKGIAVRFAVADGPPQTFYLNAALAFHLGETLLAAGRALDWLDDDGIVTDEPPDFGRKS